MDDSYCLLLAISALGSRSHGRPAPNGGAANSQKVRHLFWPKSFFNMLKSLWKIMMQVYARRSLAQSVSSLLKPGLNVTAPEYELWRPQIIITAKISRKILLDRFHTHYLIIISITIPLLFHFRWGFQLSTSFI